MGSRTLAVGLLLAFIQPAIGWGQGLMVNADTKIAIALPRPPHVPPHPLPRPASPATTYRIKDLVVDVKIADQVASTQVTQTFVNSGSQPLQAEFVFPLPYDSAVDQLTLMVDGKEVPGKLLPAADARKAYEEIVRRNQDPALLEWVGGGLFRTSVFPIPPGAERKVVFRYSRLCPRTQGGIDYLFPLSIARYSSQAVEKVAFHVTIEAKENLKNLYCPSHQLTIQRPSERQAVIDYSEQNTIPSADFRLIFDTGVGEVGATLLSCRPVADEPGYFLLLASPEIKAASKAIPKTVVVVIDRSGSMDGAKFKQAKGALKYILNHLQPDDLFNIIAYDTQIETFRPELQRCTDQTRQEALAFAEALFVGGGTNIDGALQTALPMLTNKDRPSYVFFLTDGLPTVGETNEAKIVAHLDALNQVRARMFCFGIGYDVNSRLLDTLSNHHFGLSEYVRPNEDIEERVSRLASRTEAPVVTDLKVEYLFDGPYRGLAPIQKTYPSRSVDLFAGQQLVIVGRYLQSGPAKLALFGKMEGENVVFNFPVHFAEPKQGSELGFVEKLWAMRRVGELIDELDLKGKNEELVKELVQLSTKHGILTPYTSYLADETVDRRDVALNTRMTGESLGQLTEKQGIKGVAQRAAKQDLMNRTNLVPASPGVAGEYSLSQAVSGTVHDVEHDRIVAVQTVQNVGSKTFYRRGNQWLDNGLNKEQESHPKLIKRFSPEYFALIDQYQAEAGRYLALGEPVVVELGGEAYSIE